MFSVFNPGKKINQGSPWRDQISNAILQLQESGEMQELYTKWWEKEDINLDSKCDFNEEKKKDWASKLDFSNIGGIFLVLAAGLSISFVVAVLEFFWNARKVSEDKVLQRLILSFFPNSNLLKIKIIKF
jgi:hypothetical protein